MQDKLKVWFDKEKKCYRVYMPDGTEMPGIYKHRVSHYYPDEVPTISIEAFIEILNEMPKTNA